MLAWKRGDWPEVVRDLEEVLRRNPQHPQAPGYLMQARIEITGERRDEFRSCCSSSAFGLYTFTAGPYVVPYRDAGEMTTVLSTLGVAHPPGYPLYTLMGKIAMQLPVGSAFYRANLFSALCAAGALVVLFAVLRRLLSVPAALAATVCRWRFVEFVLGVGVRVGDVHAGRAVVCVVVVGRVCEKGRGALGISYGIGAWGAHGHVAAHPILFDLVFLFLPPCGGGWGGGRRFTAKTPLP